MSNSVKNTQAIIHESDMPQGSAEWLAWRKLGIGGSDSAVAVYGWEALGIPRPSDEILGFLGDKPKFIKTPHQLVEEKTGQVESEDLSDNPNIIRGKRMEPLIRAAAEQSFGIKFEQFCLVDPERPHRRVSLDGLGAGDKPRILEIKAPGAQTWDKWALGDQAPVYYVCQLLYQAAVVKSALGVDSVLGAFALGRETGDGEIETVIKGMPKGMPKGLMDFVVECVDALWAKMQAGESVVSAGDVLNLDADAHFVDLVRQYKDAKAAADEAAKNLKAIEAQVKEIVMSTGRDKVVGGGITATSYFRSGSFNWAAFTESKGITPTDEDKDQFTKAGSTVIRIDIDK